MKKLVLYVRRFPFRPIVGIMALVSLVTALVIFLTNYVSPGNAIERNEFVRTLAQIVGGTALLAGLVFTWKTVQSAERTVRISTESHLTERYSKAVEQLGSDNEAIRLGGVYALERLAKDSDRDFEMIMKLLQAFIRARTTWNSVEYEQQGEPYIEDSKISEDVQAALRAVTKEASVYSQSSMPQLDLSNCNLANVKLDEANLEGANLSNSYLYGASLIVANLKGANFWGAHLQHAQFVMSDLTGASLDFARLQQARFWYPSSELILSNESIRKFNTASQRVNRSSKEGDESKRSVLQDGGELLRGAGFIGANVTRTDFRYCDLRYVFNLTDEQMASAVVNESTIR